MKSGGWSGINVAIHHELSQHFDTFFVGPISPPTDYPAKIVSKIRRLSGKAGSFHFFSNQRLKKIAELVSHEVDAGADFDFFHGPTPWILYDSPRPYFLYVDTCFSTYIQVYHQASKFLAEDLKRIRETEARWLNRATRVFFGTRWALERVVADYNISSSNLSVVGAGGSMTPPGKDTYHGGFEFLFVALDFERKGGRICAEAFQEVRRRVPEAQLTIVGERPPSDILRLPGISYAGLLRKSVPEELNKLSDLYSKAFALIHPTSCDIQPLVISEAGYFGCPSLAPASFGIPELINDGITGFLMDHPLNSNAFAERILELATDKAMYLEMRRATRANAIANQTWSTVGERIAQEMTRC